MKAGDQHIGGGRGSVTAPAAATAGAIVDGKASRNNHHS